MPPAWRLRLIGILAAATFVPLLAFAGKPGLAFALPLLVASGLCSAWVLGQDALILEVTPEHLLGRVFSVNQAGLISLQGFGFAAAGALAEVVSPHVAIVDRRRSPGWRSWRRWRPASAPRRLRVVTGRLRQPRYSEFRAAPPGEPPFMFPRRTHLVLALVAALAAPVAASADTTFTFTGHGYGHGVGMGQYGAQGYASTAGRTSRSWPTTTRARRSVRAASRRCASCCRRS